MKISRHGAFWKWGLFALLLVAAFELYRVPFTIRWPKPHPKLKALPANRQRPTWDGSHPIFAVDLGRIVSKQSKPEGFISSRTPSLEHDVPVNVAEVDLRLGMFVLRQTDIFVPDSIPLVLTRTYRSGDDNSRAFGVGTNHPFDICPVGSRNPYTFMALILEDGDSVYFDRISEGSSYDDAVYEHTASASEFYGARISWNGDGWDLRLSDGTFYVFPEAYYAKNFAQGAATEMSDSRKHRILLRRDGARNLTEVISPSGRRIFFTYDDHSRIIEARGDDGQVFRYAYNRSGLVDSVRDQNQESYHFVYEREKMITILDSKGEPILQNYYQNGVIVAQELPGKVIYRFSYELNAKRQATKTTVTLPGGEEKVFYFNERGIASSAKTP